MAHFAELDQDNKVINVVYLESNSILDENGQESEEIGIQFLKKNLGNEKIWIKTSINNNIRGYFAVIDGYYLSDTDQFTSRKEFNSWILNSDNYTWNAPTPIPGNPSEGFYYAWDESSLQWKLEELPKPPSKQITAESFRSQLTLTEKLLWDSPDTASTSSQKAVIVTFKTELPLTVGDETTTELLGLLVSEGVFTQQRLDEIISK
jgi:hypothetical protein